MVNRQLAFGAETGRANDSGLLAAAQDEEFIMCGIAGFVGKPMANADQVLARMTQALVHRGPDDSGIWIDRDAGVALGHRRLSIIDLSAAGHQPMASASGRYVVTYNGEIYNHRELRADLESAGAGSPWRGHSDTEVMAAGFDCWGIEGTLRRLNGMFAFAVWDRQERILTIARDRLGEKPLYYGRMGSVFLFGSELKALTTHPAFVKEIDRKALAQYLRYNYVPTPRTIWKGVAKLPPAHLVEISEAGAQIGPPRAYWDFRAVAEGGVAAPLSDTPALVDELEQLLKDAVSRQMAADVPLGAFLSGGVDSSTIVALMQAQSSRPVKTFTIGFHEAGYNEAVHAAAVARHLGTDHTQLYVGATEALAVIPRLPAIYDEPFSDASQIPTVLVSEMTRRHVTVSLSGDGGDELFGGYNRYFMGPRLWSLSSRLPRPVRSILAAGLQAPASARAAEFAMALLPSRFGQMPIGERMIKVAQLLDQPSLEDVYRRLVSHTADPAAMLINGCEPDEAQASPAFATFPQTMMYLDTLTYLPDDILTKVDRASMAASLESRVPFLDHRVVEFAWRLPMSAKLRNGRGKHILREVLYRHVPKAMMERPKMGFGVPLGSWLRGPLRDWAEQLLGVTRLKNDGYFDVAAVRNLWSQVSSGHASRLPELWDVLMFQSWAEAHAGADADETAALALANG
jgi:asparagine synthase (glutamine-hydrolysing)